MGQDIVATNRLIRSIVASLRLVALCVVFAAAGTGAEPAPAPAFHRPSTEAELALNALLDIDAKHGLHDTQLHDFLINYNGGRKAHEKEFSRYFTPRFVDAVAAMERKLVAKNCGGHYVEGDMCGLESSPLNCAQDDPAEGYWHQAERSDSRAVIIASAWQPNGPITARYRMVKRHGAWVLDAVACPGGERFNW